MAEGLTLAHALLIIAASSSWFLAGWVARKRFRPGLRYRWVAFDGDHWEREAVWQKIVGLYETRAQAEAVLLNRYQGAELRGLIEDRDLELIDLRTGEVSVYNDVLEVWAGPNGVPDQVDRFGAIKDLL